MFMPNDHGNLEIVKTMPAGEFKQTCLKVLDEVGASGEPVVITKRGKPVAQLVPVGPERPQDWAGAMRDQGEVNGDLVAPAAAPGDWAVLAE